MNDPARVIAYYLPQYHPIPENDEWWGQGFTEWTNVAKAKPLFRGHYQPHIPSDLGFYDLRVPETRIAQAELARKYGIEGFCYFHYWFAGRRILERPFDEVLKSGAPDFPFCLCWANKTWTGIWHGCPDKVLIEQTYPGMQDHEAHFRFLLNAFSDSRYLTVDGKPLFFIYNPGEIPDLSRAMDLWREMAVKEGLKGLFLVGVSHLSTYEDPRKRNLDACVLQKLPPLTGRIPGRLLSIKLRMLAVKEKYRLSIYDYDEILGFFIRKENPGFIELPCVIPNWDNTPRSGLNGLVLHGSRPELFRIHFQEALSKVAGYEKSQRIILLKSWNEWAEGNHVEPDFLFGHGYLEVIKEGLSNSRVK